MKARVTPDPLFPARMSLDPPQSNWPHLPQPEAPRRHDLTHRPGFWERVRRMRK